MIHKLIWLPKKSSSQLWATQLIFDICVHLYYVRFKKVMRHFENEL